MAEHQQPPNASDWLNQCADNFRNIALELREFKAYETIDDLLYRFYCCKHPDGDAETVEEVYRKSIRIAFIGDASTAKKRDLIETAFPNSTSLHVENHPWAASNVEYHYFRKDVKGIRFVFINTPSLGKWDQVNKITNNDEWHAEAVVFVISGNVINETEKKFLERIKYLIDSNSLFFVQTTENPTADSKNENLSILSRILTINKEEVRYFSSSESNNIAQCFTADSESKKWLVLLFRKTRTYMVQYYKRFEVKVGADLRQWSELKKFSDNLQKAEDQTTEAVARINRIFNLKLDQAFPIESSYSPDVRAEIKQVAKRLSERSVKKSELELPKEMESEVQGLIKKWSEDLEEILAEYFRDISHEVSKALSEFAHSYRFMPLNRKIELQTMGDFSLYLFNTNKFANIARNVPAGFFPTYLVTTLKAQIVPYLSWVPAALNPIVVVAVAVFVAAVWLLTWSNSQDKKKQRKQEMLAEIEKDMKVLNYHVTHAIRIEFGEIVHFSQDALQNIFKEIRKAERKRVIINNTYPAIKTINGSLLDKIRTNLKSIESVKM